MSSAQWVQMRYYLEAPLDKGQEQLSFASTQRGVSVAPMPGRLAIMCCTSDRSSTIPGNVPNREYEMFSSQSQGSLQNGFDVW